MEIGSSGKVLVTITAQILSRKAKRKGTKNNCIYVVNPLIPEVFPCGGFVVTLPKRSEDLTKSLLFYVKETFRACLQIGILVQKPESQYRSLRRALVSTRVSWQPKAQEVAAGCPQLIVVAEFLSLHRAGLCFVEIHL